MQPANEQLLLTARATEADSGRDNQVGNTFRPRRRLTFSVRLDIHPLDRNVIVAPYYHYALSTS